MTPVVSCSAIGCGQSGDYRGSGGEEVVMGNNASVGSINPAKTCLYLYLCAFYIYAGLLLSMVCQIDVVDRTVKNV